MTQLKHVLVLVILILPMFALAPSLVAGPNEVLTNRAQVETNLPAQFAEETLRVAVYAEDNTSLPSYATGGVYTDHYANVISLLESAGYAVTPVTTQDILDRKLMVADYDAFVLPNQLPRDSIINHVKDYWLGGGGILSFEGSAGFLFYSGMVDPSFEGQFSLWPIDSSGRWAYFTIDGVNTTTRHPVTKSLQDDTRYPITGSHTVLAGTILPSLLGDRYLNLGFQSYVLQNTAIVGFDNPDRGGRIVQLPGNCSQFEIWLEPVIIDSIDWLAPRPKAQVAFDYTHAPFYGIDDWDENVTWGNRYYFWRDSLVNHSFTVDKLYPTPLEELTADDLAPFDVLVINLPSINYTASEIAVIQTWVQNGGGLYLLGEFPSGFLLGDQLIESIIDGLGITFYTGGSTIGSGPISEFEDHPILEGVGSLHIAAGSYLNVSAPAYPIAYDGQPNVAMAGRDYGVGRILLIGDINGFDHNNIDNEDNYQLGINIINWLSSATAKVLVYADSTLSAIHPNFVPLNGPVAQALNDLGESFYMTSDIEYFNLSLFSENWDLVVFDNNNYFTNTFQPHLIDFVEGGGKVVFNTWILDASTGDYFGVDLVNTFHDPPAVYLWESGHPIFNFPVAYDALILNTSLDLTFGTDALNFTTYANATPLAGYGVSDSGVAIAIGAGGNVIVNGPLIVSYDDDIDDSTYPDNLELWINQISFLYYDRPTIDHPDDVTYMETETGNEIVWTPTADAGPWTYTLWINGSTHGPVHWDGGAITIDVDGVNASITTYELMVYDRLGYSALDSVTLNVTEYVAPTGPGGPPVDPTLLIIIGAAVAGIVIILVVVMMFKKKK